MKVTATSKLDSKDNIIKGLLNEDLNYCKNIDQQRSKNCKRKSVRATIITELLKVSDCYTYQIICHKTNHSFYNLDCTEEQGNCGCIHAETKAIISALKTYEGYFNRDCILLCTVLPCKYCAITIAESELISEVHYLEDNSRYQDSKQLFSNADIRLIKHEN